MEKDYKNISRIKKDKQSGISEKIINLLKILNIIESGKYPSIKDIMDLCEISERTAYRYLNIINFIIPIEFNKERGGYNFFQSKSKRIITIEDKEKVLLKGLENFLGFRDDYFKDLFKEFLNKVILCPNDKDEDLYDKIVFSTEKSIKMSEKNLEMVIEAITNKRTILIEYNSIENKVTKREIEPLKLFFYDGIWFLNAYCRLRQDYRTFALDRIISLEITKNEILMGNEEDLEEIIKNSWKIWGGKEKYKVILRFLPAISEVIRRKPKWHESEKRVEHEDGTIVLTFELNSLEEIKWFVYSFIPYVEVIEPDILKEKMVEEIKKFIDINKWKFL